MKKNKTIRKLIRALLKGFLFVTPLFFASYIIFSIAVWLDNLVPIPIAGLGILLIIGILIGVGYLSTSFLMRPIFQFMEESLEKIPIFRILFTSIKEVLEAFVGEDNKFSEPVLVQLDKEGIVLKMGFITCDDLAHLDLDGYVSVYLPHSYNFSGNNFIVKTNMVKPINVDSTEAMKFIVSGGVSQLELKKPQQ